MAEEHVPRKDAQGFVNYDDPETLLAVRRVFFRFASHFDNGEAARPLAASLRIYACLPRYGEPSEDPHFYPVALLPATSWINTLEQEIFGGRGATFLRPPDESLWMVSSSRLSP